MGRKMTADRFAAQLREAGCKVYIDTLMSGQGRTYIKAAHVDGEPTYGTCVVFDEDGFVRGFNIRLGGRGRRRTYRSMAATRRALGIFKESK